MQSFCREHGVDMRRSYLAGLALEEMAGNIVAHGFRTASDVRYQNILGLNVLTIRS